MTHRPIRSLMRTLRRLNPFTARSAERAVQRSGVALLAACLLSGPVMAWAQTEGPNNKSAPAANEGACPPAAVLPDVSRLRELREAARDRGMLWRIEKEGRTSWLFGTLHLGRVDWVMPGPALRAALSQVDVLALELDVNDPGIASALQRAIAQSTDVPLPAALSERIDAQARKACIEPKLLATQHPVMRTIALSVLAGRWDGLDPGFGQEYVLAGAAQARQLPVVSLETPELQIRALMPRTAAEGRSMVQQMVQQLESGAARRAASRLSEVWAEGKLEELGQYERWCECVASEQDRQLLRRLNDDRNPALAARINNLHASGQRVLAAVGALHMTGPKALPALLAEMGYTVERVTGRR